MLRRVSQFTVDHHREVVVAALLVTVFFAAFLNQVTFQTDVEAFLPDSEVVEQHRAVETLFGRESHVAYFYLRPAGDSESVLALTALQESLLLAEAGAEVEHVENVISVAGYFDAALQDERGRSLAAYNDSGEFWGMVYDIIYANADSNNYSAEDVNFLIDVLVDRNININPFYFPKEGENRSAPLANSTLIIFQLDDELTPEGRKQVGIALREVAQQQAPALEQVEVTAFSVDLLAYDVDQSTSRTNMLMGIGMFTFTVAMLWLAFRHWSFVALPLATLLLAVVWTFGFVGLVGIQLTAIDVAVLPLVVGLGIDFAVHISRRYQEELRRGRDVREALVEAQVHTGRALTLAAGTTVIAFLSGITAGVGPVRDFSLICAAGIAFAFVLTLTFHTALRYWLDGHNGPSAVTMEGAEVIERVIVRTAMAVERQPRTILAAVALVTLAALFGATQIEATFGLDDFLSEDLEVMVTAFSIQSEFRGASYSQSQVLIHGPIIQREVLRNISTVQEAMALDTYVINLGAEARVDSVYEVVRDAITAEPYAMTASNNTTHETLTSIRFGVTEGEELVVTWQTTRNPATLSLEAELRWEDANGTSLGSSPLTESPAHATVPPQATAARLRFTHLQDGVEDMLVEEAVVRGTHYLYVQSVQESFNLTYKGYHYSETTSEDIQALFDYLYHRQDVVDRFTGQTYANATRWVLHRNADGEYDAMLIRVFIGPKPGHPLDNQGLDEMLEQLEADLPADAFPGATVAYTGGHVLTITTVNAIQEAQVSSTILAVVLAAILLMAIYRHVGFGLLTILPVLLATVWILATMWVLGISLNVLTVMVTALTVGLGIDYAIHIVERYREERQHLGEQEAIEATVRHTGSALLISGVTTVCGFAVLILSPMPLVRNFGIITAATIVYAVLIAVLVLPSLLWAGWQVGQWWEQRQQQRRREP